MTKLLYLITTLETGGAQKGMARICNGLKRDFDIRIVGLIDGDRSLAPDLDRAGLDYRGLGFQRDLSDLRRIGDVGREIQDFKPDILVCSLYHSSVLGAWFGRSNGVTRIISWEHSGYLGNWRRRLMKRWIDGRVWKVFCDSQAVFDDYRRVIGSDRGVLMPIGGVDTSEFKPREDASDRPPVVVSVGRLERIKGYDLLIESAKELVREIPEVTIRIAAVGSQRESLLKQIRRRGLENNVRLEGLVTDVPTFLSEGDIYLQPSRHEGQCVAVIEAMACGLPVLAASAGGIREVVEHGVSGFLADAADAAEWNAHLKKLIEDPVLRSRMGERGREIVTERYSIDRMVDRFRAELNTAA